MKWTARITWIALAVSIFLTWQVAANEMPRRQVLEYAPAPVDNPLKGLVPYAGEVRDRFPHSMEFNYIPLSALVTGYGQYDWQPLENLLNAVASRGHQTIFRVHLEWPGKKNLIPTFLINDGLQIQKYRIMTAPPHSSVEMETPDYADANLRKVLKEFIAALGKKYDGDPRIGFVTAGLLGTWGEWHVWQRDDLFASTEVQLDVMDAYEAAFKKTPILLRYPAGKQQAKKAPNAQRRFGYHDDSFAWSTLGGKPEQEWFFMPLMQAAGPEAFAKWKTQPIGGEIRPEAWGKVFDADPGLKEIQDFRTCVDTTHVSWLMDSGMFTGEQKPNADRVKRALCEVRRMGYEFYVPAITMGAVTNGTLAVKIEVENRGVAPFYYDWPVEFGLLDTAGRVAKTFTGAGKITGLLPGDQPRVWEENLTLKNVKPGTYHLALRIPNPLPNGIPVRFANVTQDQPTAGWLTLTAVIWR